MMVSLSCGAARLRPDWNAAPFPLTVAYCTDDLQRLTLDGDRVIRFSPIIGADPKYAKVTASELDDLRTVLRSAEYGAAMRPFRVKKGPTICGGASFVRVEHSQATFDVPLGPSGQCPAPFLKMLQLVQQLRDKHFGDEFEPLLPEAKP